MARFKALSAEPVRRSGRELIVIDRGSVRGGFVGVGRFPKTDCNGNEKGPSVATKLGEPRLV